LTAQDGSIFEISPASLAVIDEISVRIKQHGGCAIIVDYGYAATGLGDTLQCLSNHRYADTLEAPGQHDITAHVDFSTLKAVAEQHVTVAGPAGQGDFLFAMGIGLRAEKLKEKTDDNGRADIDRALKRLTAPDEMGQLFKVLVLRP
jgi:NADH dehydrogenase [ubiquinone] 1 alpha subcomplex assembly factor 7